MVEEGSTVLKSTAQKKLFEIILKKCKWSKPRSKLTSNLPSVRSFILFLNTDILCNSFDSNFNEIQDFFWFT